MIVVAATIRRQATTIVGDYVATSTSIATVTTTRQLQQAKVATTIESAAIRTLHLSDSVALESAPRSEAAIRNEAKYWW